MVNFAELKAKAEKVKDASVTKVTNTRDRFSSVPASKTRWDPNWKRAPPPSAASSPRVSTSGPPLPPPQPDTMGSGAPPVVPRRLRPTDDLPEPPPYTPPPPPSRATSGYPPSRREVPQDAVNRIDWANLSLEDKQEFFGWLDEFFSHYLEIKVGPRPVPSTVATVARASNARAPPMVNMMTRPQV